MGSLSSIKSCIGNTRTAHFSFFHSPHNNLTSANKASQTKWIWFYYCLIKYNFSRHKCVPAAAVRWILQDNEHWTLRWVFFCGCAPAAHFIYSFIYNIYIIRIIIVCGTRYATKTRISNGSTGDDRLIGDRRGAEISWSHVTYAYLLPLPLYFISIYWNDTFFPLSNSVSFSMYNQRRQWHVQWDGWDSNEMEIIHNHHSAFCFSVSPSLRFWFAWWK